MGKRKSNRAVRRLLARHKCPFRISNRRWMEFSSNYPFIFEFAKPSRSQRRAAERRYAWLQENASTDCDYIGIADNNPQFHC